MSPGLDDHSDPECGQNKQNQGLTERQQNEIEEDNGDADTLATVRVSLSNSYSSRNDSDDNEFDILLHGYEELSALVADDDDDDGSTSTSSSSSSSSSEESISEMNIKTSFISNILFFIGSALSVWIALWDLWDQEIDYLEDELTSSSSESSSSSDDNSSGIFWTKYNILSVISAIFLISNSTVDIVWSIQDAYYERGRNFFHGGTIQRRSKLRIGAAIAFGFAACCDLASVFYSNVAMKYYYISTMAVHVYLINAILTVFADKPSCSYLSSALTASGDILFLIASIIDVVLSYYNNTPSLSDTSILYTLGIINLISSILWIIDAKLYIAADLIEMEDIKLTRRRRRRRNHHRNNNNNNNNTYQPPSLLQI